MAPHFGGELFSIYSGTFAGAMDEWVHDGAQCADEGECDSAADAAKLAELAHGGDTGGAGLPASAESGAEPHPVAVRGRRGEQV